MSNILSHARKLDVIQDANICQQEMLNTSTADTNDFTNETEHSVQNPYNFISIIRQGTLAMHQCKKCFRKFKTRMHMKYHEFCGWTNNVKPFKCEFCEKRFVTRSHYYYHIRVHTGERPYQCQHCDRRYAETAKLTRHMRTHTGEKPYACNICSRRFR